MASPLPQHTRTFQYRQMKITEQDIVSICTNSQDRKRNYWLHPKPIYEPDTRNGQWMFL